MGLTDTGVASADGNKIEEVTTDQFGGTNDGRAMTTTTTATNTTTTTNNSSSHSSSHSNSSIVFEGTNGTTAITEDRDEELVIQQQEKASVNGKESLSETSTGPTLVRRVPGHRSRADSASDSAIDYGIVRIPSSPPTQKPLIELPESRESGVGRESRGRRLERISVTLYIQMELCGLNLKTWISRRNRSVYREFERISESEGESGVREFVMSNEEYHKCLNIFRHILTGVSFLHANHLIHRDLKPQNILFDLSEETVKIGDFGLATLHEEDVHVEHSPLGAATSNTTGAHISLNGHTIGMGTTLYVAPEQRVSSRYDVKADMYSLGIILFELLHPFNTMMEKEKRITDLKTASLLPPDFVTRFPSAARVIRQLTSVDPSDRPSADQVLRSDLFPSKDQVIHDLESQVQRLQEENRRLLHLLRLKDRQAKVN